MNKQDDRERAISTRCPEIADQDELPGSEVISWVVGWGCPVHAVAARRATASSAMRIVRLIFALWRGRRDAPAAHKLCLFVSRQKGVLLVVNPARSK